MSFVALRPMKVQKADGSYDNRKPGDAIPEAATWPNLGNWIKRGYIKPKDGKAAYGQDRGARKPMRAVTPEDLAKWEAQKTAREQGTIEEGPGFTGDTTPGQVAGGIEDSSGGYTDEQLDGMKKAELLELAEGLGLDIDSHESKATIAQAILDAQASA